MVFFGLICLLSVASTGCLAERTKLDSIEKSISIIKKIYSLSREYSSSYSQDKNYKLTTHQRVFKILKNINHPQDLSKIATLCYEISYPQEAEDISVDTFFSECYFISIKLLAGMDGPEVLNSLMIIQSSLRLHGGDEQILKSHIEIYNRRKSKILE